MIRPRKHDRDDDTTDEDEDEDEEPSEPPARRGKRQKYDTKEDLKEDHPPAPTSPEEYAIFTKEHYKQGEGFTLKGTSRDFLNQSQHEALTNYLNGFCLAIVMMLITHNLILLPNGILFDFVNYANDLLSINTSSPYVYYLFWPGKQRRRGKRDKVGCTGNGKERLEYYWKEFKDGIMPTIISLLNINAIPIYVQKLVTAAILQGLVPFLPSELPETIADATRLEMNGLPVHTIMFFWAMVKSYDDNFGGAIIMAGCLLRLYLMVIESGLQVFLGSGGDRHEAVNNSLMGFFFSAMDEIWEAVEKLFSILPRSFLTERQVLRPALSSWAPGRVKGACPQLIGVTVLIMNMIFGEGGWVDVFLNPPCENPPTVDLCFNTDLYSAVEKVAALNVILRMLRLIEKEGGITAIETNSLALSMSDPNDLVELMLLRRPFGDDGPRWEVLFVFFRVTVMVLYTIKDDLEHVIHGVVFVF